MYVEPTDSQYNTLRNYIEHFNGKVIVEINDGVFNKTFDEWTKTKVIINNIKKYFKEN